MGTLPFLLLLVLAIAVVIAVFAFLGRWGYLILLGVAVLIRRLIWRHWLPPAWAGRLHAFLEQYAREPHGKLRLVLATLLALGGYLIALSAIYGLFHPVQPVWFNALAAILLGLCPRSARSRDPSTPGPAALEIPP